MTSLVSWTLLCSACVAAVLSVATAGKHTSCDLEPTIGQKSVHTWFNQVPSGNNVGANLYVQLANHLVKILVEKLGPLTERKLGEVTDEIFITLQSGPVDRLRRIRSENVVSAGDCWSMSSDVYKTLLSLDTLGFPDDLVKPFNDLFKELPIRQSQAYWMIRNDLMMAQESRPSSLQQNGRKLAKTGDNIAEAHGGEVVLLTVPRSGEVPNWNGFLSSDDGSGKSSSVRALVLRVVGPTSHLRFPVGASLPALASLTLDVVGPFDGTSSLRQFLASSVTLEGFTIHARGSESSVPPEAVEFVCDLLNLQFLHLWVQVSGLPACFGSLSRLRSIDVRWHQFRTVEALPAALASGGLASSLLEFTAFSTGSQQFECPPKREPFREQCMATVKEDDEPTSWRCPRFTWTAPFGEPQPWWGWRKLRKLWLDGCLLTGTIPENIGEAWPELRTLDLYDNALSGSIPASFGKMQFLGYLLLHGNNLSGNVPLGVFAEPRVELTLYQNPKLDGCMPRGRMDNSRVHASLAVTRPGFPGGLPLCGAEGKDLEEDDDHKLEQEEL